MAQTPPPPSFDIRQYYPAEAARLEIEGSADILCSVRADGTLAACEVIKEDPPGYGFGEAALKMSHLFKMRPRTVDGVAVAGGKVRVPLRFKLPA